MKARRAENLIFHAFIEEEHNSIAEEYEIGAAIVQPVEAVGTPAFDAPVFLGDRKGANVSQFAEARDRKQTLRPYAFLISGGTVYPRRPVVVPFSRRPKERRSE